MLNMDDLLAANLACKLALISPANLRQLLSELDAHAPPGSLIQALYQRGVAPDRLQHLEHATRQRRAQLETQYFVASARAHSAVDPGALQALSQQQAADGFAWSLADRLVNQGFISRDACLALTREAVQQLLQREQLLLQENRRQGYAMVLETGTTSGRHLVANQGLASSSSGRLPTSSSGVHQHGGYPTSASGSGAAMPRVSPPPTDFRGDVTLPPDGFDAETTLPVDGPPLPAPVFDGETTMPVDPPEPGFDPGRTIGFDGTLDVPVQPPPEPDFSGSGPTMLIDPPDAGGAEDGLGNDPCRTIGFEQVLMTPVGQPGQLDEMDAQRTMQIPAPNLGPPPTPDWEDDGRTINLPPPPPPPEDDPSQMTINLPPQPPPTGDPFGTMQVGPGGSAGGNLDATITMRPDLSDDVIEMPPGLDHVRELGRGNMGIVHLARQPDQRLVAVKVIQNATKDASARFRREILVSSKVQHKHVIEVLDSGTLTNGQSFMTMEYLEGRELKELIQAEAPLPIPRCLELLDQLLAALEATHNAEIVHRDLKPENVQVLTRQGGDHVKLVDFGISRLLTQAEESSEEVFVTMRGTLSGTPMYVAPEAIVEPDTVTKAHDIYAAGVILYEMLTGKLPFPANRTLRDLLRDTVHSRPTPLEEAHPAGDFPPPIKRLVAKLLDKDDQARPSDGALAREVLHDTQRALGGGPVAPKRRGPSAAARRPGFTERLLRKITGIFRRDSSDA